MLKNIENTYFKSVPKGNISHQKSILYSVLIGILFIFTFGQSYCQLASVPKKESKEARYNRLRMDNHPFRNNIDVKYYKLTLSSVDVVNREIQGKVDIYFDYNKTFKTNSTPHLDTIQIDLIHFFKVEQVGMDEDSSVHFKRDSDFIFIPVQINAKTDHVISIYFKGKPNIARKAPWDGGFVWGRDSLKRNWVSVACEGEGASSWWPCKDYLGDEPDSMEINIVIPDSLYAVSNGKLRAISPMFSNLKMFTYVVDNPINLYNVTLNIGKYTKTRDTVFIGNQTLKTNYYFLDYQSKRAKAYFPPKVKKMFEAYYHFLGDYPFAVDGFSLVQTPYWGMEHQNCVSYGNNFKDSFLGFPMDFILIHETAHEYFGNSLSMENHNELWLHEGFTTFCETLYLTYNYGDSMAIKYINGQKKNIRNELPIISKNRYNKLHDNDIYYKGAWYLYTLKSALHNDKIFYAWLKNYSQTYTKKIISTLDFKKSFEGFTGLTLDSANKVYLYGLKYPTIQFKIKGNKKHASIKFKLDKASPDARLPIYLVDRKLEPTYEWQKFELEQSKQSIKTDVGKLNQKYLMNFKY